MSIIEVRNLRFSYGEGIFIKDMFFNIEKGSYTCIVGANGSGKTTVSKLISGLLEAEDGEIFIDDMLLNEDNSRILRKKIGVLFQNPDNQYVGTTLRDDIIFGLENYNVDPSEMDDIIEEISRVCKVYDLLDKEPHSMSGGQKQKGAIAGILALAPEILILDEASSMLDPRAKRDFKANVRRLQREKNLTVISITHDMSETLRADKVIVLDKGKIVFDGSNIDLYNTDLKKYNLELPRVIELQKELGYKKYVLDEDEFFKKLEGEKHEN